ALRPCRGRRRVASRRLYEPPPELSERLPGLLEAPPFDDRDAGIGFCSRSGIFPVDRAPAERQVLVVVAVVVVDVEVVRPAEDAEKFRHLAYGIRMADIDRDPDALDIFGDTEQFLGIPAEKLPDADHVLEAGERAGLDCCLTDLRERFFLDRPDLFGHEFADGRDVTRVERDPRRSECPRVPDAGADLTDRFAPDRVVDGGQVEIAVGS